MTRVCAWCHKVLGTIEPLSDTSLTHGICELCRAKVRQAKHTKAPHTPTKKEDK